MTCWSLIRTLLKNVLSDYQRVQDPQQCFPKSSLLTIFGSQDFLFWSARKQTPYICSTTTEKCVLKSIFFSHLFVKLSINPTIFISMVCRTIFYWFCGPPKYFSMYDGVQVKQVFLSLLSERREMRASEKCHSEFGCRIEPRSSCTVVMCATGCATPHPQVKQVWETWWHFTYPLPPPLVWCDRGFYEPLLDKLPKNTVTWHFC